MPDPDTTTTPPAEPTGRGARRWVRPVASWVLTILASVAIASSVLAVWVQRTILDTEDFMEIVSPVINSDSVQAATSEYLSDELIAALDLEERIENLVRAIGDQLAAGLAEALELTPAQAELLNRVDLGLADLAAPIASGIESRIRDGVDAFVRDPDTSLVLIELATVTHERTILLLRDELDQLPNVVVADGEVRLNLVPLVAAALRAIADGGTELPGVEADVPVIAAREDPDSAVARLATAIGAALPPDFGQVRIMTEDRLEQLQDLLRTLDRLVWALILVAIGLVVAAVATAPSITSGGIRVAMGGAIGLLVGLLGVQALAAWLTEAAGTGTGAQALEEVTTRLVGSLQPLVIVLAIVGFGAAAAAHFAQNRSQRQRLTS